MPTSAASNHPVPTQHHCNLLLFSPYLLEDLLDVVVREETGAISQTVQVIHTSKAHLWIFYF